MSLSTRLHASESELKNTRSLPAWLRFRACVLALAFALAGMPCVLTACSSAEDSQQEPAAEQPAAEQTAAAMNVTMQVTVADGEELFSDTVELPEGATALDALEASGLEYVAEDSEYGAFVSKIGDVANGEPSPTAGWTYTLNGEMVMESCDTLVLSDGDTLVWEYAEFE